MKAKSSNLISMSKSAVKDLSFEQALQELEGIVRDLETGKAPLSESITSYERGVTLKNHCDALLKQAQEKIEKITVLSDGSVKTGPLDEQS